MGCPRKRVISISNSKGRKVMQKMFYLGNNGTLWMKGWVRVILETYQVFPKVFAPLFSANLRSCAALNYKSRGR